MKNAHFCSIFGRLGPLPQVFGQVKEWFMLELSQIIRTSHEFACPIIFIFFDDPDSQGRVFKIMKNDCFLVFLAVWVLFPKILGRLRSALY